MSAQITLLTSLEDLAQADGWESWADMKRAWDKHGDCSIWQTPTGVGVGTCIPGNDAEFSLTLDFPFTQEEFNSLEPQIDIMVSEWYTDNQMCEECITELGTVEGDLLTCPACGTEDVGSHPLDPEEKSFHAFCCQCDHTWMVLFPEE